MFTTAPIYHCVLFSCSTISLVIYSKFHLINSKYWTADSVTHSSFIIGNGIAKKHCDHYSGSVCKSRWRRFVVRKPLYLQTVFYLWDLKITKRNLFIPRFEQAAQYQFPNIDGRRSSAMLVCIHQMKKKEYFLILRWNVKASIRSILFHLLAISLIDILCTSMYCSFKVQVFCYWIFSIFVRHLNSYSKEFIITFM